MENITIQTKTEGKTENVNIASHEKVNTCKKEQIKSWLNNKGNLLFLAILILGIAIRIYYFNLTKNQPLWWDEADYMAYAKNLAGFNVDWIVTAQHNSLFPYIAAVFFKLGFSEALIRFILEVIPSILLIPLAYYTAMSMYKNQTIALISATIISVLWELLFNTFRFHLEVPGLFMGITAIYVFFRGYENKEKIFLRIDPRWAIPLTAVFSVLAYAIRRGYFLFGLFFAVYILCTKNWKDLIKDKYNWYGLLIGIIFIWIVEKTIFYSSIGEVAASYTHTEHAINFKPLGIFSLYYTYHTNPLFSTLLYLFWIGLVIALFNVVISIGYIKKTNNISVRGDLFNIVAMALTLSFFIFIMRNVESLGEARWYFPLVLSSFVLIGRAANFIEEYVKKYYKIWGIILVTILILYGAAYELKQADFIIKNKIPSFEGIKQASLFIKSISNPNDAILSVPEPQVAYYAERPVKNPILLINWTGNNVLAPIEPIMQKIGENRQYKYIFVSFSEPNHPEWMKKVEYANNGYAKWEIPFMNTTVDFLNKKQDIKEMGSFQDINFKLLDIKEDVFIYEIIRSSDQKTI